MGVFILRKNEQMIAGIPIGKLNNLDHRVSDLEQGGGGGSSFEAPSETPDGSNTVFTFAHTPSYITLDGLTYYEDTGGSAKGYSLSGTVATFVIDLTPQFGSVIQSHYSN